jgi:hypothetical protein|tara:strand:- start:2212 stop:2388 length:177 start_codon:yes stop_codon:yes gene_type:complete
MTSVILKYIIGGISLKNNPNKGGGLKNPSGKTIIFVENCGTPIKNISVNVNIIRYSAS